MSNNTTNYAFLMIEYDTPQFIKELQQKISKDDIFEKDDSYGIERETHVTLVPCLDNDIDLDEIKKILLPLKDYEIFLSNISSFKNEEFDVLKCDAQSMNLYKTNREITDKFETHSNYKEYHPHMTVAYLKKDTSKKYEKEILDSLVVLKPKRFHFSYYKDGVEEAHEYFK